MNDACDSGLGVLDVLKLLRKFPFAFGVLDPTHVLIRLAKQVVRYELFGSMASACWSARTANSGSPFFSRTLPIRM